MRNRISSASVAIEELAVSVYVIPTSSPESDGTLEWKSTTMVLVELSAGKAHGMGYTYACRATAQLINEQMRELIIGRDAMDIPYAHSLMVERTRNLGRPGIVSMAISAVDVALWDLKAKLLNLPLASLLGVCRESIPIYGSGGFTSYSIPELQKQLSEWVNDGIPRVKMKVGRNAFEDPDRVQAARTAIGKDAELFVDANGAYSRKQALRLADKYKALGVAWFEEPVNANDLQGLHLLRNRVAAGVEIASGEYGYELSYFRQMLEAKSVDVLQADVTRCGGISGFLRVAALSEAYAIPLSAHCAPSLHVALGCALAPMRHLEYFYDHVRIEKMIFDGICTPQGGALHPDCSEPGLGLEFRRSDAQRYAAA